MYEVKSDIFEKKHQRKIQKLIDALQLKPLVKVKIRKTGKLSNGVYRHCHHNAIEVASKLGGKVVTGYVVTRYNDLTTTSLLPHSVWLSPENNTLMLLTIIISKKKILISILVKSITQEMKY